jgi:hypothetical protein
MTRPLVMPYRSATTRADESTAVRWGFDRVGVVVDRARDKGRHVAGLGKLEEACVVVPPSGGKVAAGEFDCWSDFPTRS